MPTVLDIGSGAATTGMPKHYADWKRERLDIDPAVSPDILLDARHLSTLPAGVYSAVYSSHNLEHYHRHDGLKVLAGMRHVCKSDGFVEIHVPDIGAVVSAMVQRNLDIDDVLYESPHGPILVSDVIYGYHVEIEHSGSEFYAHRTGFTAKSLLKFVQRVNFDKVFVGSRMKFELTAYAFCSRPKAKQLQMLGLSENLAS